MEKLDNDKKKEIVQKIIDHLSKTTPDLYYVDTMTVSTMVVEYIAEKKLSQDEFELVKSLDRHDVQTLMSYNSNCC